MKGRFVIGLVWGGLNEARKPGGQRRRRMALRPHLPQRNADGSPAVAVAGHRRGRLAGKHRIDLVRSGQAGPAQSRTGCCGQNVAPTFTM
jgi:hypothetical protein